MGSSTSKRVLVRRFGLESVAGIVNPQTFLQPLHLELLRPDGAYLAIPYSEVKTVSFVRDLDASPDPTRMFLTRPKQDGLWVRMVLRDGEIQDGVLPNNLLAWELQGYTVTPPESDSNNQRVFVPREALRSIQVLGVVGSPLRAKKSKKDAAEAQPTLF